MFAAQTGREGPSKGVLKKEKIIEDVLQVKLRNLELASVRRLFYDELAVLEGSFTQIASEKEQFAAEYSESLIRICWYYESAFALVSSLLESCGRITSGILQHAYRTETRGLIHRAINKVDPKVLKELDPALAGFLDRLNPALARLSCDGDERQTKIREILAIVDTIGSNGVSQEDLAVLTKVQDSIECLYQTIQEYLSFTDDHFASLIG